jgi:hypothetical protein
MSEAEKQKIVIQISAVQTELQRTIDERYIDVEAVLVVDQVSISSAFLRTNFSYERCFGSFF